MTTRQYNTRLHRIKQFMKSELAEISPFCHSPAGTDSRKDTKMDSSRRFIGTRIADGFRAIQSADNDRYDSTGIEVL